MSLDIGIGDGTSFVPLQDEPRLALEDDGYSSFLVPLFQTLRTSTGQMIGLYDFASFSGDNLDRLEEMLKGARCTVENQPATWEVCVGCIIPSPRMDPVEPSPQIPVFMKTEKSRFLKLLDQWEVVISRARELGRPVVCFGD